MDREPDTPSPHRFAPPASERLAEELLRRTAPRLRAILGRYRIPHPDGEDLLQDALVLLVRQGEKLRDPEAYLVSTLRFRCLMFWRSHGRRRQEVVEAAALESLAEPQPPAQETASLRHDLRRILAGLSPPRRRLIRLRYGLGYTVREVAEQLGATPEAVRQRSIQARSLFARHISRHGYFGGSNGV
ncbi:MAG: sigma-70 family RNA polymerase sigma factor [Acidobacteria bacterium]|nr:sigma-70 family RNA polymerase sigma factor [Acidobacteriota bacterium]